MNVLYLNDLRTLPNLGCRSTGPALEELLKTRHRVIRRDGRETVDWSGWDRYALQPLRTGGILSGKLYSFLWRQRFRFPKFFRAFKRLDARLGARHDFVHRDPSLSVGCFNKFCVDVPGLESLVKDIQGSDAVVVNGEGTLIFGCPMRRDALYLLFLLALAQTYKKPTYLLNAMISECPTTGASFEDVVQAGEVLRSCTIVGFRDFTSYELAKSWWPHLESQLELIPDALFSWASKFRAARDVVKKEVLFLVGHPATHDYDEIRTDRPYLCLSGSSAPGRSGRSAPQQYAKLGGALKALGLPVIFVETCFWDGFLRDAGRLAGLPVVAHSGPVIGLGGLLAGAEVYITGRYHPSIMASAGGVPCVFLGSNSHKTSSVQELLGYPGIREYSSCPGDDDIVRIVHHVEGLLSDRRVRAENILRRVDDLSARAHRYADVIRC